MTDRSGWISYCKHLGFTCSYVCKLQTHLTTENDLESGADPQPTHTALDLLNEQRARAHPI